MTETRPLTFKQRMATKYKGIIPVITCGAGLFSDGYENGVIGDVNTILGILYPVAYVDSPASQNVSAIVFAGTVLGQLVFGYASDHWSRKNVMLIATVGLMLFAGLSASSYGAGGNIYGAFAALTVFRFFLGIFIGAEYPAGSVACAEATTETPKGSRNFLFILFTNFCIDFGFVVSAFVPLVLLWIFGLNHLEIVWRFSLALGVIPPLSIFYLRLKLKEPEQFKRNTMRGTKTPWALCIRFYWKRLLAVSAIWFIYDFSSYAFTIYGSHILTVIIPNGSLYESFGWNVVLNLFYLPGAFLGAYLSDKLGPKRTLALGVFLQSISGYIMAGLYGTLIHHIAGFVVLYGLFQSFGEMGAGDNIGLLASKVSATAVRGQFYGIAAASGKIGAFVGTYVFPIIIRNAGGVKTVKGLQAPFWVSSSLSIFSAVIAVFCLPNISQMCIEEEDERFRAYLVSKGWDTSKLGVYEGESVTDLTTPESSERPDGVKPSMPIK